MTSILDNELVKKYFGYSASGYERSRAELAFIVLAAMQEPIRKGERLLLICQNGDIIEQIATGDERTDTIMFQWNYLRLPDCLQKRECLTCGCHIPPPIENPQEQPRRDEVEEKIEEIRSRHSNCRLEHDLRELVELARKGK